MKKKFLSAIMAIAMLMLTAQNVLCLNVFAENVVSADSDGIYWIEESDYDTYQNAADGILSTRVGTNGTAQETADMMSGGDAHWAWWGGTTYSTTYKVNVSEAGSYKLWYRGSDPTNGYSDTLKIKVNGTEITVSKVSGTDFTATIDPAGTKKNFACAWFVTEVFLTTGENVIAYEVLEKSTSGQKYACLFDCMVLAPSNFEWKNPSVSTKPEGSILSNVIEFNAEKVAKFEESQYSTYSNSADGILSTRVGTNGTAQETADSMSGGDAHWAWWSGVTYSAAYKINAPEAGTYKLWYRGSDPEGEYHDTSVIKVNGVEAPVTKVVGTDFVATIDPAGTKKNYACGWFITEVTLVSGVNVISYEVMEKSTAGGKYAALLDCMVLAPSTYVWNNPKIDTYPAESDEPGDVVEPTPTPGPGVTDNVIEFDESGVAKFEESDYATYSNSADGILSTRVGVNGTAQETADSMSGGDAYWAWWGGTTYSATYKVNAPEAGTYKLWYRGSDPTNEYSDTSVIKVNGTEVTVSKVSGTDFVATIDPAGTKKNYACGWFVVEIFLSTGENTISYEVLEKSTTGGKYACLFDCMVLAPSSYEWEAPSISTKPEGSIVSNVIEFNADKVAKFEESDYTTYSNSADGILSTRVGVNGTEQATADSMSGGDAHWAWWGGTTYSATYKVNAPEAGTYKLWYRGSDPTNGYSDTSKIKVNGVEVSVTKVVGTDFVATIDPAGTKKNYACGWFIAEVTLVSGVNVISYEVTEKSTAGGKYAALLDCMVLAPSTYVWNNPKIDTYPEAGAQQEEFVAGDVDGNGLIETRDIILVRRHIAGGYGVEINIDAADVDKNGLIETRDIILMRRFIAGGYDVELK